MELFLKIKNLLGKLKDLVYNYFFTRNQDEDNNFRYIALEDLSFQTLEKSTQTDEEDCIVNTNVNPDQHLLDNKYIEDVIFFNIPLEIEESESKNGDEILVSNFDFINQTR
jgi:hypothetical protein